jgi:putative transposase
VESGGWPGCDYYSKYEYGWHLAPGCTGADAIAAVRLAIAEAEAIAGGIPLRDQLPVDPDTGQPHRIKIVTTTVARSKAPRSPRSSHPAPSSCTSAPAARVPAKTAYGNARSDH